MMITILCAFKEFVTHVEDIIDEDALYITLILEGSTDSDHGILRKGDFHVYRGVTFKYKKATYLKK